LKKEPRKQERNSDLKNKKGGEMRKNKKLKGEG
jgi:hypothetical protein